MRRTPSLRTSILLTVVGLLVLINALVGVTVWGQRQRADRAVDAVEQVTAQTLPLVEASQSTSDFGFAVGERLFTPGVGTRRVVRAAQRVEDQIDLLEDQDLGEAQDAADRAIVGWRRHAPDLLAADPGSRLSDPRVVEGLRNITQVTADFTAARTRSLDRVEVDLAAARREQGDSILMVALLASACGVGVLVLAYVLIRAFLRPVRRMRQGVTTVASGDLAHRLPVDGPAELAELAEAFNAMAHDLADREAQLIYRALHDPLTGCGNRALLHDRLAHALTRLARHPDDHLAVLLLDLDGFKSVNDTLGHSVGDEVLRVVCDRIRPLLRQGDTLVRLGGDEFAILVGAAAEAAIGVAERICGAVREPMTVADQPISLTASVGLSTSDDWVPTSEDLVRHADIAMYAAKRLGGDRVERFLPLMDEQLGERTSLVAELRHAVVDDEIVVHYQPIVRLGSTRIVGAEALVRWRHPRHGLLQPARFLDLAEETGAIIAIGTHVLRRATVDAVPWAVAHPGFVLSVNVSARQLADDGLADEVIDALDESGFPAAQLVLEITETTLLANIEDGARRLEPLTARGVRIALDDFGTGYTSLRYLSSLPIDTLKIDRVFVDGMADREDQRSLVKTIIELAHRMRCAVIAEGIERVDDAEVLRALGCDTGQGFLFHHPVPRAEIDVLMGVDPRVDQLAESIGSAP